MMAVSLERPKRVLVYCFLRIIELLLSAADVVYPAILGLITYVINKKEKKFLDEDRIDQEIRERPDSSDQVAVEFVKNSDGILQDCQNLSEMGSRLQKFWYGVVATTEGKRSVEGKGEEEEEGEGESKVLTVAPVSVNCPIKLDEKVLKTLNSLLHTVQHPLLHSIDRVHYDPESGQVIIVQPIMTRGSLKDLIYEASPTKDWSVKYSRYSNSPLTLDKVACYGRQILEAVLWLYEKGFPPLGHIQTGNIFVEEGGVCKLGGYENRLLGYRTRLYNLCQTFNCTEDIDIIMFGYVVFEMACGYELTRLVPGEGEYRSVKDEVLKDVLRYIFNQDEEGRFTSSIKEILGLDFFQEAELPHPKEVCPDPTPLTRDMKHLLSKVIKGKGRRQVPYKPNKNRPCRVQ